MGTPSYINCLQANNGWPTHPVIQSKNSQLNSDTKEEKHNHHIKPNPLNLPSSSLHRHKILNTGERSQKKVTFDFSKRDYSLSLFALTGAEKIQYYSIQFYGGRFRGRRTANPDREQSSKPTQQQYKIHRK
ncbi:hypothetical protein KEM48_004404 [Puccinia striiformis f. sp. tritici PST-130]|nr:hypothetical protein KEM48_004404 [Puccinia striiformis f. sp. tritici PST-130]